jgi:ABC-type lipoprotein release transport system permease subunit
MSINIKMAWRNIWRHPRRSLLTIAAILFASILLIFSVSLQLSSYDTMIDAAIKRHTGHLQIQASGYNEEKKMRQVIRDPAEAIEAFEDLPQIKTFSYRANTFSLVSSDERTYGVWVVGVDPVREKQASTIAKVIRQGRYLLEEDTTQALMGTLLAKNLAVDIGDELVLLGQGLDGSMAATVVTVKGIFSTGQPEFDRSSLQMPLSAFQETFSMGQAVHEIVVIGKDLGQLPQLADSTRKRLKDRVPSQDLKALTWQELLPGLEQSIQVDMVSGWISYGILVIIVAFGIMNTFLMAVMERTREFGMLLAVGMRHGQIARLFLMESALMTLLGIVSGIVCGCLVTYYFQVHGFEIPGTQEIMAQWGLSTRLWPRITPISVLLGPALILVITLLTAIYPVLRIYRLQPVKALRAV